VSASPLNLHLIRSATDAAPVVVIIGTQDSLAVLAELEPPSRFRVMRCESREEMRSALAAAGCTPRVVTLGTATIDLTRGLLHGPRGIEQLTRTELRLAQYLDRAGGPRAARRIGSELFERTDSGVENLVHKHIANLRAKLARTGALPQPVKRLALGYEIRRGGESRT